jgi:hypothetical protein
VLQVFNFLHIALKALVPAKIKLTYNVSIFFLKSGSNLHLPIQFLEGADARCLALVKDILSA